MNMKIESNPYTEMNIKNNMSFDQAYNPMNLKTIDVVNNTASRNERYNDDNNPGFNSERITPKNKKRGRAPPLYNW